MVMVSIRIMQRIRWPKDFYPFSGDSDSDTQSESKRNRNTQRLHIDVPTSSTSTTAAHAPVLGVYLFCNGDQVDLSSLQTPTAPSPSGFTSPAMGTATVSQSDAVFNATVLPISNLIGVPLLMRRLLAKASSPSSPHFDNPLASQLQIDPSPSSSPAASSTSRGLGTVLVVRADKKPLQKELLDRVCAYHARLLALAQQRGAGSMSDVLKTMATPEKFMAFCMESQRQVPGTSNSHLATSVLSESWLDLQRPMAAV
ncbi:hypothetical protein FRC17_007439 [Serendipita sp. 399]|nr:hypothetical protein FRC17_007439 [Serendipita sp. 399]